MATRRRSFLAHWAALLALLLLLLAPASAANGASASTATSTSTRAAATASGAATTTAKQQATTTTAKGTTSGQGASPASLTKPPLQSGLGELPWYPLLRYPLTDRMDLAVNLANGNLIAHATDLVVWGTGLDLVVDRYYNSLSTAKGLFGNWTMGTASDVQLLNPGTSIVTFVGPGGYQLPFAANGHGGYTAPAGADATLVQNGDGSYTLTFQRTGERYQFAIIQNFWGNINSLTGDEDRNGNTIAYAYNTDEFDNGEVSGITDTQGRQVGSFDYGFNDAQPIQSFQDSSGRTYQYGYDNNSSHLLSYTDPANQQTSYAYDASYNLKQITDPAGRVTTLAYDGSHRVTSITFGAGTSVAGTYTFTYNAGSTVVTDPNNHQTTYAYDASGRLTQMTDALGDSFHWAWTADNHVSQYTDAKGQVTAYGYDANNNLNQVTLPTGATASAAYGTVANIPNFYVPTSATDALGNQTTYGYDGNGNLATISMPAMVNSQSTVSTINETIHHNPNGTIATIDDFNGNTTAYSYDAKGNLTKVTPPSYSGSTQLGPTVVVPDSLSRPSQVTDGNGHTTTYTYDALDRVTKEQYPDGAVGYGYDADGDLTSMTDNAGQTTYQYDARNRPTQKTLPASLGGGTFSYGYDPASNLTSYADAGGTVTYHYNAGDELDYLLEPSGAKTTFAYDANRHRTSTAYPGGVTMTVGYDNSQRVASVTATNASATLVGLSYSYATGGKDTPFPYQVQENDAPGVGPSPTRNYTTTYNYDPRGLLLTWNVHNNANGTTVHDYEYEFDANGNRTQIVADATVSPPPPNPKTTLAYNPANELTSTSIYPTATSGTPTASATWTWDPAGQLTGNTGYPGISGPLTVQYNQHGQTTAMSDAYGNLVPMAYTGPGQAERTSAGWSNEPSPPTGKPAEFGATSYTYSALGLMSRADATGTTYYTYDPFGLLVSERTPNGTYYFLYNGLGDVAMLVDGSGNVVAITSPCPTGNQSGDQWSKPGSNALEELLFQGGGAFGVVYDPGTGNTKSAGGYSGASGTGPTIVGLVGGTFYLSVQTSSAGEDTPGVGGLGGGGIDGAGGPSGEALPPEYTGPPISGGSEEGGMSWEQMAGMLQEAAEGKGNFGIGTASYEDAQALGEAWVGPGYRVTSVGSLESADKLRLYRPPSFKPQRGTVQANLESRYVPSGPWINNAHIDILYGPPAP